MFQPDLCDLIKCLHVPSHERTDEEHDYIFAFLRGIDELKHYRETLLKSIAWIIRHEAFPEPNTVIYKNGSRITHWYILLTGSIFLGGKMFLPTTCFGRKIGKDTHRREDCICLEPCDLLVIDTPDMTNQPVVALNQFYQLNQQGGGVGGGGVHHHPPHGDRLAMVQQNHKPHQYSPEALFARLNEPSSGKRMSHSSDTSSAYSGSGDLEGGGGGSSLQNCDSDEELQLRAADFAGGGAAAAGGGGVGVQVTPELPRRVPLLSALEKEPNERCSEDIELLLESFQRLHAFSNFTRATQRQFAACMLYAVVENPGQVVLDDGEKLDSWSVIVDGDVEIQRPGSAPVQLHCGDAFGVKPTTERQHHVGVMKSLVPMCRFAFITQEQYCHILSSEAENSIEIRASDGSLQLVKEIRTLESGTLKKQHTVIRGTPQALIDQLLECRGGSSADANYADDFLLTYRTFLDSGLPVARRLLDALSNQHKQPEQASRAIRVFVLWANNHFNDFDDSPELFQLLRQFEHLLERRADSHCAQNLHLLRIACSTKSRPRRVALQHGPGDGVKFHLVPSDARGLPLCYVRQVPADSTTSCMSLLRVGDQLLTLNGAPVEQTQPARLRELLLLPTTAAAASKQHQQQQKLELTVRWDPLTFHKLMAQASAAAAPAATGSVGSASGGSLGRVAGRQHAENSASVGRAGSTLSDDAGGSATAAAAAAASAAAAAAAIKGSTSNPDLSGSMASLGGSSSSSTDLPDHVIRVFRPDGAFKLLCINRETSAREVVMLSVQEFSLQSASGDYKLMEVSVNVGPLIRRRTLPDCLQDLGNRLALNARYYVKHQTELADQFLSDADALEVLREAAVDFLQLDPQEVAMRITLEDFGVFQRLLPTQLVDWWHKQAKASKEFTELSGVTERESTWPLSELSAEQNSKRRVGLLKHFLKVSQHCRQLNNLNTLMSLTLGLAKTQNSQLNPAWDKLPKKYRDLWKSLEKLTDIRMNHSSYRQLFKSDKFHAPAIPYLPILCKDLTAIRECNERMQDGLVNFEKLRLLAREVRGFCQFAQAGYEGHAWRGSVVGGVVGATAATAAAMLPAAAGASSSSSAASASASALTAPLRRAGSSSALTVGGSGGIGGSSSSSHHKRRSAAVAVVAKKLHDEAVAEKKLADYVRRLRLPAGGGEAAASDAASSNSSSSNIGGPISTCPEVAPTAGTRFHAATDQQFNRLISLSDGKRPARHQHIPGATAAATAPAARPPLPPPYLQVMQQRLGGGGGQQQQQQPPPQPPPRSDTTVATTRPPVPPPYHQAVAAATRRESLG